MHIEKEMEQEEGVEVRVDVRDVFFFSSSFLAQEPSNLLALLLLPTPNFGIPRFSPSSMMQALQTSWLEMN